MIIGINGYAASGKDTAGQIIKTIDRTGQWRIRKFAGKLKRIASMLTNIPIEKFEDQEFKKTNLDHMWSNHGIPMTVREFLQKLGTDALREGLHSNAWVNALMCEYTQNQYVGRDSEGGDIYSHPNWVITDVRFPNEARAIKNAGGIVVRINRPGYSPINDHPSEIALDKWDFDYCISNDGTIDDLRNHVNVVLKQVYENTTH